MQWDHYYSDAPVESDQWAISDRGWLYLDPSEHPDRESDSWFLLGYNMDNLPLACGNYLYYAGRGYHAVAYIQHVGRAGTTSTRIDIPGGPWYQTREEAATAIQRTVLRALGENVQLGLL